MNKQLAKYMNEVGDEVFGRIPNSARWPDHEKVQTYPPRAVLSVLSAEIMSVACKARREGARNRAEALEWAYDSLIRNSGYVRVGEVYKRSYYDEPVPRFEALVIERDELD